ncbi:MAG: NUDIX domain-containing protein [Bacteroidetes bacterium]|nr:MAG: NUDIX domain-containing protein [Bacteroidota bacterium]
MKIFALNLCLEFRLREADLPYTIAPISFEELMSRFFRKAVAPQQQFFVTAEDSPDFLQEVFDLQGQEMWRAMEATITFWFEAEEALDGFLQAFMRRFRMVRSAGGLVTNERGEYLTILNRGRWTLPKGHIEPGETADMAALREVQEETGLAPITLGPHLADTYHTFRRRRGWAIKVTHWYRMEASSDAPLTPQKEEDIEAVAWKSKSEWLAVAPGSYPLTRELFERVFQPE